MRNQTSGTRLQLAGWIIYGFTCAAVMLIAGSCGSDSNNSNPPPPVAQPGSTPPPLQQSGGFNFSCKQPGFPQQQQQQAQQVNFQPQQQASCNSQQIFQFQQAKVSDFDVTLDCTRNNVIVQNKGFNQKQKTLPIQQNGAVQGQIQYLQQVSSDGKGTSNCWVALIVNFNGTASCGGQTSGSATEDFVSLDTSVMFQQTTPDEVQIAAMSQPNNSVETEENASPSPSPSPSVSPSPSPSPSESPSETPSPSPSPDITILPTPFPIPSESPEPGISPHPSGSPFPRPSISPRPTPSNRPTPTGTATFTQIMVCRVENPCPTLAKANMSCPK